MNIRTLLYTGISVALIMLAIGIFSFHEKGYRLSMSPFSVIKPATLIVTNIQIGDILLIGDEPRPISIINGTATLSLPQGEHDVIVARTGAFPYRKIVTLVSNTSRIIHPLLLPTTPIARVMNEDEESRALETLIRERVTPTKELPRKVAHVSNPNEIVALHVEDTSIIATWNGPLTSAPQAFCTPECVQSFTVTTINTPIKNVEFYPGRTDVALFSTEGNIYAIELDKSPIQNFQPIFTGGAVETPFITVPDRNGLFVIGTSSIFSMELPL